MSVVRVRKDKRYFTASNESFQDKRLLWETRGLLGYLFTKPDHWEVRMEDLEKQGPAGNHKLRRMLADARKHGYMNRIRITRPNGTFEWITEVFESPAQNPRKATSGGFSTSGSSTSGKVPDIVSTDSASTDERFKAVYQKISHLCGGAVNPLAADLIQTWLEKHEERHIFNAIAIAQGQGAKSEKYVDKILIGWEANGYPKPREQKVREAKSKQGHEKILEEFGAKHNV
jgi:DnaD/phage-associated family protein